MELIKVNILEALSFNQQIEKISKAFRTFLRPADAIDDELWPWDIHVFEDFVTFNLGDKIWKAMVTGTTEDGDPIFAPKDDWVRVEWEPVEVSEMTEGAPIFGELFAEIHMITETTTAPLLDERYIDLVLMEPGWGNKRDMHYYGGNMLKQNAHKFDGVKMYEVNHKDSERTNRTWVSTIVESGDRFTPDGAPVAKAYIHNNDFLERTRNLQEGGLISQMANSIVATGKVVRGMVEGVTGNIVQEITEAKFVDWVPSAGAGGHALALYQELSFEADFDLITLEVLRQSRPDIINSIQQEMEEKRMTKETNGTDNGTGPGADEALQAEQARVKDLETSNETLEEKLTASYRTSADALVQNSKLPPAAQERLTAVIAEMGLDDKYEAVIKELITKENEYLAEVGQAKGGVANLGESAAPGTTPEGTPATVGLTEKEETERLAQFDKVYG